MPADLWNITRGPRIGEDIVAWCEEQCTEAVTEHVAEGMMVLVDRDEAGNRLPDDLIVVRFLVKEAARDDPTHEKPLAELIQWFMERYTSHKDGSIRAEGRDRVENLLRLLRAKADEIEALLKR